VALECSDGWFGVKANLLDFSVTCGQQGKKSSASAQATAGHNSMFLL
jgi:hypothetical protein